MLNYFWTLTQRTELEDFFKCNHIPAEVENVIYNTLKILDENYGAGREMEDDGGYIVVVTDSDGADIKKEYAKLLEKYHITEEWCEFRDKVCVIGKKTYFSDLYIVSSEFAVTIVWIETKEA